MKSFFTFSLYAKTLALSLFFCAPMVVTGQVLFTQNFNASTTASTYASGTPSENQFDFLSISSGANAGWSTNSTGGPTNYPANRLRTFRFNGAAAAVRTTDFVNNAIPTILKIKFKLEVLSISTASASAASFYVGTGLAAAATGSETAITHSRLVIGFSSTTPTFVLTTTAGSTSTMTGGATQYDVTWYINNSGASTNYTDPNNGTTALADDKADIWVGTTRVLSDGAATTGSIDLTDFKFLFSGGGGTIAIDDLEISTGNVVLPMSLTNFTASKAGASNQLTWTTESETNNKGYNVERQSANGTWTSLGFVNGTGKASTYTFEDKAPLSISYYRLRQIDFDGKETLSKIVSVSQNTKGRISISPNPTSDKVTINLNQNDATNQTATLILSDMTGRQVFTQTTTANALQLDLSNLAKGMYVMTLQFNNAIYQEKIIRQ